MDATNYGKFYGTTFIPGVKITREGLLIENPDRTPNDCPYCGGGDAQHNRELIDEEGTLAYIDGHWLRIETFAWSGDATDVSFEVAYCPKCGRKLEDDQK